MFLFSPDPFPGSNNKYTCLCIRFIPNAISCNPRKESKERDPGYHLVTSHHRCREQIQPLTPFENSKLNFSWEKKTPFLFFICGWLYRFDSSSIFHSLCHHSARKRTQRLPPCPYPHTNSTSRNSSCPIYPSMIPCREEFAHRVTIRVVGYAEVMRYVYRC